MGVLYLGNQKVTPFVYKDAGNKYGATVNTFIGDVDVNGKLLVPTQQDNLVFNDVITIDSNALYSKFYKTSVKTAKFPNLKTIETYGMYGTFDECSQLASIEFNSLETVSDYGMQRICYNATNLTNISVPKLKSIGRNGLYSAFFGTSITEITFPELTTLVGAYCLYTAFSSCSSLRTVRFPKLTDLTSATSQALGTVFTIATALEDVYFNALTTSSFGSSADALTVFNNMVRNTGTDVTHTLHFPSNLESTIQGLTGYPLFGGTSGYVVLAYDLPATE